MSEIPLLIWPYSNCFFIFHSFWNPVSTMNAYIPSPASLKLFQKPNDFHVKKCLRVESIWITILLIQPLQPPWSPVIEITTANVKGIILFNPINSVQISSNRRILVSKFSLQLQSCFIINRNQNSQHNLDYSLIFESHIIAFEDIIKENNTYSIFRITPYKCKGFLLRTKVIPH